MSKKEATEEQILNSAIYGEPIVGDKKPMEGLSPEIQAFEVFLQQMLYGNFILLPKVNTAPKWAETA